MSRQPKSLLVGRILILVISIVFMIFSVIVAATPLRGEEEFVGTTYQQLRDTNPRLAAIIWHYTAGIGTIAFGVNLLIFALSWKGFSRDSSLFLSWASILVLSSTFVVAILVAHVPIGHLSFSHWGPPTILTLLYFVGLAVSAKPTLSKR